MSQRTPIIKWCDSQTLHAQATDLMKSVSSVLDIGCGIRPQQYIVPSLLICVEPHLEYVEILKRNLKDANAIIIPLDAKTLLAALPSRSVDSIFLIDVIEHMPKEIGIEVIIECERVARVQVVLFTPLGFMPQEIHAGDADGWNLNGGDWQDHKSGWYPEDFPDWDIVACKHLHFYDYQGQPVIPPYGGFYAIKNILQSANYFNNIYSKDIIEEATSALNWIDEKFPQFVERVVRRDIENSMLKCGIHSCQRTTELFIEIGSAKTPDYIFQLTELEKSDALLKEARMHNERIKFFAAQFLEFNSREADLTARAGKVAEREADLTARAGEVAEREADLTARAGEVAEREADLTARAGEVAEREADLTTRAAGMAEHEAIILNGLCAKISRKLRSLFR